VAGARVSAIFDRLPIRTRLAVASALLTFAILFAFALVVGSLTVHRIRSDFNHEVAAATSDLAGLLQVEVTGNYAEGFGIRVDTDLNKLASSEHAVVRILFPSGRLLKSTSGAPDLGLANEADVDGYRVHTQPVGLDAAIGGTIVVQYGRPLSEVHATIARVELLLVLGVLAGTGLALLAGAMIARRAMQPIARLTLTAAEIARTRDPSRSVPQPEADDEVAELARTLRGMLRELDDAHAETEATLARQRRFVADASHELRTPLTSVLANLELLAESLRGDEGEAARSALRSSRRMRRLVADLLLLARTDVGRVVHREPVDLAQVVLDAAAELGPLSAEHELVLDVHPAIVQADHDELLRVTLNLLENAMRHTPPRTSIWVSTGTDSHRGPERAVGMERAGDPGRAVGMEHAGGPGRAEAVLVVEDSGPGVPPELAPTLFERFVRGAGGAPSRDGAVGGSFGLGLAIVRAVAESHGGTVTLERTDRDGTTGGARFVVRLPLAPLDLHDDRQDHRAAAQAVVDQLR
jgi:two-component system, OmpR family, sensor kinase